MRCAKIFTAFPLNWKLKSVLYNSDAVVILKRNVMHCEGWSEVALQKSIWKDTGEAFAGQWDINGNHQVIVVCNSALSIYEPRIDSRLFTIREDRKYKYCL